MRARDCNESAGLTRLKWLTLFAFLALLALFDSVHDFIGHLEGGEVHSFQWSLIYADIVFWGPYILLVPAAVFVVERAAALRRPWSLVVPAIAGLIFTYLHVAIVSVRVGSLGPHYATRFWHSLKLDFALDYSFFWALVLLTYFWRNYAEIRHKELKASQLEASLAQARMRAVEGQLNPHFFFNTLQSVSVLALSGERDRVVEFLATLSGLLRVSFDKNRPQMSSLTRELAFIDDYLTLQRLCLGPRLSVQQRIAPGTLNAAVPSLILQPLVENAIIHGISAKPGRGTVRITTRLQEGRIAIEVADSGPGFPAAAHNFGVGLSATVERLRLLFGTDYEFSCGTAELLGGASVEIRFPFVAASADSLPIIQQKATA